MEDSICPRCGKTMTKHILGSHYYYYCIELDDVGCDSIYADDPDCYFSDIYIITSQGELKAYKSWKGGEIIPTIKFLDEVRGMKS